MPVFVLYHNVHQHRQDGGHKHNCVICWPRWCLSILFSNHFQPFPMYPLKRVIAERSRKIPETPTWMLDFMFIATIMAVWHVHDVPSHLSGTSSWLKGTTILKGWECEGVFDGSCHGWKNKSTHEFTFEFCARPYQDLHQTSSNHPQPSCLLFELGFNIESKRNPHKSSYV